MFLVRIFVTYNFPVGVICLVPSSNPKVDRCGLGDNDIAWLILYFEFFVMQFEAKFVESINPNVEFVFSPACR